MSNKIKTNSLNFDGQLFSVGIDVHKNNWKTTIRSNGHFLKSMSIDPSSDLLAKKLNTMYPGATFNSVYEAGFSGFWLHRELTSLGINNIIVNPADVPTSDKEKERKSDPIDSNKLSRERDNNSLIGIYIPTEEQESIRSLSRLLDQYRKRSTQVKNRIKGFLHFTGKKIPPRNETSHWSNAFISFLKQIEFSTGFSREILDIHLDELARIRQQQLRIIRKMRQIASENQVLSLLRTIPGIGLLTAFTIYAELMHIHRFKKFDSLAAFVGLVPSVSSSDEKIIMRGLTHRHPKYLRYLLVEAAWHAVRKDPALTKKFLEYTQRMSKQKAIIRIAKKLLSRIRYVWQNKKPYKLGVL